MGYREQKWKEKQKADKQATETEGDAVTKRLDGLSISEDNGQSNVSVQNMLPIAGINLAGQVSVPAQKAIWKPKSYGSVSGGTAVEVEEPPVGKHAMEIQGSGAGPSAAAAKSSVGLSKLFKGNLLESFTVDNSTYALGQIRATFYPKFENEKSDQEVLHFSFHFI